MFCPHCGHINTLPGKPLTGDDFMAAKASRRGADMPRPGEIYRQHDPVVDQWHEYEVKVPTGTLDLLRLDPARGEGLIEISSRPRDGNQG